MIIISPSEKLSNIRLENYSQDKSNRLCFNSEKLNILKNYPEALSSLKESIELDSNNSTALHLYATMLNQQNAPECVSFYEKSLKINARSYLSFNGLGNFI